MSQYGKGKAFYLATESSVSAVGAALEVVKRAAGVEDGLATPEGVFAREVEGRTFYINTNYVDVTFPINGTRKGLISSKTFQGAVTLPQRGAELIE